MPFCFVVIHHGVNISKSCIYIHAVTFEPFSKWVTSQGDDACNSTFRVTSLPRTRKGWSDACECKTWWLETPRKTTWHLCIRTRSAQHITARRGEGRPRALTTFELKFTIVSSSTEATRSRVTKLSQSYNRPSAYVYTNLRKPVPSVDELPFTKAIQRKLTPVDLPGKISSTSMLQIFVIERMQMCGNGSSQARDSAQKYGNCIRTLRYHGCDIGRHVLYFETYNINYII